MAVRVGTLAFAAYNLALGFAMVVFPHAFYDHVGPFGLRNDHYIRDNATFSVAFGVGLLIAYRKPSWRAPLLCCLALQFGLHAINHLADIGAAHPRWIGRFDFISLAAATVILAWLARAALKPPEEA